MVAWQPLPAGSGGMTAFGVGDEYCHVPTETPEPTPLPRDVAPEAQAFHAAAREFGLPMPFDTWPVQNYESVTYRQGYGPNMFAFTSFPPPYNGTHQIHSGIDFVAEDGEPVVAVCDGIIIGGRTTGAYSGFGLSLRCFTDDLRDVDGDGFRNLSNISVSYNHLGAVQFNRDVISPFHVVSEGQLLGEIGINYRTRTSLYHCLSNDAVLDDCRVSEIIAVVDIDLDGSPNQIGLLCMDSNLDQGNSECSRENTSNLTPSEYRWCYASGQDEFPDDCHVLGDGSGTRCEDTQIMQAGAVDECKESEASSHLHLETFLVRGSWADIEDFRVSENAIRLNPLLMFDTAHVSMFTSNQDGRFGAYYADDSRGLYGLGGGILTAFSQGGDLSDLDFGKSGFFQIQEAIPVNMPEWWRDGLYDPPLDHIERMFPDVVGFLHEYGYAPGSVYVGPNCLGLGANLNPSEQPADIECTLPIDQASGDELDDRDSSRYPPVNLD